MHISVVEGICHSTVHISVVEGICHSAVHIWVVQGVGHSTVHISALEGSVPKVLCILSHSRRRKKPSHVQPRSQIPEASLEKELFKHVCTTLPQTSSMSSNTQLLAFETWQCSFSRTKCFVHKWKSSERKGRKGYRNNRSTFMKTWTYHGGFKKKKGFNEALLTCWHNICTKMMFYVVLDNLEQRS